MVTCALDFTLPDFQNPDGTPRNPFSDGFGIWGQAGQNTTNLHMEAGPGGSPVIVYDIRWEAKCVGDCPDVDGGDGEMEPGKCNDETWDGEVKFKIDMGKAFPTGGDKGLDQCMAGLRKCANNTYNYAADTRRVTCMKGVMGEPMGGRNEDGTKKLCSDGFMRPGPAIGEDGTINPAVEEAIKAVKKVIAGLKKEQGALKDACDCDLGEAGGETPTSETISRLIQGHVDKVNEISMKRMKATSNFRNSSSKF